MIALLLVGLLGCGGSEESPRARATDGAGGTARMRQLLVEVAERSAVDNPFLGVEPIPQLQADLAALPDEPDLRRWLINKLLGKHLLRMGREEESIEHYLVAYAQLEVFRGEIPPEEATATVYELAVAYMRWAETLNCALRHTAESCILPIRAGGVHSDRRGAEAAVEYLEQVLAQARPDSGVAVRSRWLLNVAYMTLGGYPQDVPPAYLIDESLFDSDETFPRFRDVAPQLGLDTFGLAGGAIAEDFDGDGWLDLMVSTSNPAGQMKLFLNTGSGGFRDVTSAAGLDGLTGGLNMIQADYDNDGDRDVLVLRGAWWRQLGGHPNSLLRNDGAGHFEDVTFAAGLGQRHSPTQTADWADYDNDGDLDLYIGNEWDPNTPAACQLFRNNADGTFTDVAAEAGVENERYAKAVSWGDYDNDRDPDLFVSNMGHDNRLYRNNADGTFTDVAAEAGVVLPRASFPSWFWDYDNDGALDLFVAGYGGPQQAPDLAAVVASYLDLRHAAEFDRLYKGDGQGGFRDVAPRLGLTRVTLPMGSNFGDLDGDGYLDFYLGTGYPYYEALMPNLMYRNREGQGFSDVTTAGGFGHAQKGHGIVFADLDHDGDQDVFEQMGGQFPGDGFGNALFLNPGFGQHWLKVELQGVESNRAGIGARIRVDIVERGVPRTIYKHVNSGGSFGGNPMRQEIGLGAAERIERLEVYWPTSDTTQQFDDLMVDGLVRIVEGATDYERVELQAVSFEREQR